MSVPTTTYRDILEALSTDVETIAERIEFVLSAGEGWPGGEWSEVEEENCEAAIEVLAEAFDNEHLYRAVELAHFNQVADVLEMDVKVPDSPSPGEPE